MFQKSISQYSHVAWTDVVAAQTAKNVAFVCFHGVTTLWLYFPQPRSGL